jgi:hypothetical protein
MNNIAPPGPATEIAAALVPRVRIFFIIDMTLTSLMDGVVADKSSVFSWRFGIRRNQPSGRRQKMNAKNTPGKGDPASSRKGCPDLDDRGSDSRR